MLGFVLCVKEILDIINTTLEPRTRDGVTPKLPPLQTDANEQEEHAIEGDSEQVAEGESEQVAAGDNEQVAEGDGEHVTEGDAEPIPNNDGEPSSLNDPTTAATTRGSGAEAEQATDKVDDTDRNGKDADMQDAALGGATTTSTRSNDMCEAAQQPEGPSQSELEDIPLEKNSHHAPSSSQSKEADSQDMSVDDRGAGAKKSGFEQASKDNNDNDKEKEINKNNKQKVDDPMDIDWTIFTDSGKIDAQTTELKFDRPTAPGPGPEPSAAAPEATATATEKERMMAKKALKKTMSKSMSKSLRGHGTLLDAGINDISAGLKPPEEEEEEEEDDEVSKGPMDAGMTNDIS